MDYQGIALLITTATTSVATLVGLWVTIHNIRRNEKIKIKISVMEGVNILNSPIYDEHKLYNSVNIVNTGQIVVNITKVGSVNYKNNGHGIFANSMIGGVKTLKYDDAYDCIGEVGESAKEVAYYYVQLRNGKTYKKYMKPRIMVWFWEAVNKIKFKRVKKR